MASTIPTKEQALEIVAPISPEIYRAFEHGISKATIYFENEKIERDPWAFAMVVKLHAREHLQKCSEFSSVVFDRLSLCGIGFHYKDWQIRLWRSADHSSPKLPHPGHSESKRKYYVQQGELFPETNPAPAELRFVILWDVDKDSKLEALWLVCPRNFNQKTGEITVHWAVELPNPIFGIQAPSETRSTPDLPYLPKKEKEEKEG